MKRIVIVVGLLLCAHYASTAYMKRSGGQETQALYAEQEFNSYAKKIYSAIGDPTLSFNAFEMALKGYFLLKAENKLSNSDVLTVIDFSKPATENRFYLIDLLNNKMLVKTLVAHGRNTGEIYATSFSNKPNSYQSSLGLFLTGETYIGAHGLSLRLDGTERTINDNARVRDIVVHAADYVSGTFINSYGRLGRSLGCPALPMEYLGTVIDKIKNGSCFFAYYPDPKYLQSTILSHSTQYIDEFRKEQKMLADCR
jgi:hypothetical protein